MSCCIIQPTCCDFNLRYYNRLEGYLKDSVLTEGDIKVLSAIDKIGYGSCDLLCAFYSAFFLICAPVSYCLNHERTEKIAELIKGTEFKQNVVCFFTYNVEITGRDKMQFKGDKDCMCFNCDSRTFCRWKLKTGEFMTGLQSQRALINDLNNSAMFLDNKNTRTLIYNLNYDVNRFNLLSFMRIHDIMGILNCLGKLMVCCIPLINHNQKMQEKYANVIRKDIVAINYCCLFPFTAFIFMNKADEWVNKDQVIQSKTETNNVDDEEVVRNPVSNRMERDDDETKSHQESNKTSDESKTNVAPIAEAEAVS